MILALFCIYLIAVALSLRTCRNNWDGESKGFLIANMIVLPSAITYLFYFLINRS